MQRALSEAFAGNVAMAAQIVQEADWLQQRMVHTFSESIQLLFFRASLPVSSTAIDLPLFPQRCCPAVGQGESRNEAASTSGEDGQGVGGKLRVHRGADLSASDAADPMIATVHRPFLLNLHGLSQSAARIALVQVQLAPCFFLSCHVIWIHACSSDIHESQSWKKPK